jgi:response regulator RpfG family c-di-GMP phosphodiesterase
MNHSILFIDDEPMILSSLERLFEDDYTIFTAESGSKALEILRREKVSVIVSDQRMPEMLGHEVLSYAKDINPNAIRILLTGYSDIDDTIRSINDGEIFRYVNKPWQAKKLAETVSLACELHEKTLAGMTWAELKSRIAPQPPIPVLIVDSHLENVSALRNILMHDYTIFTATTSAEAFHVLASKPIHVVLLESLPDSNPDEAEFLAMLKSTKPEIVPVMISISRNSEAVGRLLNEGNIFRYLTRPFSADALKGIVGLAAARYELYKQAPEKNLRKQENSLTGRFANETELATPVPELLNKVRDWHDNKKAY